MAEGREACVKGWHKQQVGKQSKGPYQESRILEQAEWDGSAFTAYEVGPLDLCTDKGNMMMLYIN